LAEWADGANCTDLGLGFVVQIYDLSYKHLRVICPSLSTGTTNTMVNEIYPNPKKSLTVFDYL